MHGPGLPPQHGHQPTSGGVVTLRVLFALLPLLSCGFFAFGSLLRLALVTRKTHDWLLTVAGFVLSVSWLVLIGMDPTEDASNWQGNLGAGGSIVSGLAICVYFLVADIKHYENASRTAHWYPAQAGPAPYAAPQHRPPVQGYGYPPAQPQVPAQPPMPPQHHTPPPRIGQVRAELDELSELLRKQPPRDQDPNR
ncbi:hypothetical protein [Streptomyces sp. cmx-4-9]|uniref:hypothetical protein n=1 Tax=Streptomyces sp. cmx-4-9 TaxID=2790941 RepID=UPI0039804233